MAKRKKLPSQTVADVITRCRRRCCICFGLDRDESEKRGQIAHLDHDASNNLPDNLAFLCLHHHDDYDSQRSQSKGLSIDEVKHYRAELLAFVAVNVDVSRATRPAPDAECALPLALNLDDTFAGAPSDFSLLTRRLIFALKKDQPTSVHVLYPELDKYQAEVDTNLESPSSSNDDALRVLDYVRRKKKRAESIQAAVNLLFSPRVNEQWSHRLVSESDWQSVFSGVLNWFSSGARSGLTKIDIWRTEEPQLSAPIFVNKEELNSILQARGLSHPRELAFGPGWVAADELPPAILVGKAMPRMIISMAASADEIRDEHFDSALFILSWHVGLG